MTQLRVFEDSKHRLWIEITFPKVRFSRSLFMRAFWEDTVSIAPLPKDEIITTEFQERKLLIAFLIVESRRLGVVAQFKNLGYLDTDSSRNALNHLLDILAYDG